MEKSTCAMRKNLHCAIFFRPRCWNCDIATWIPLSVASKRRFAPRIDRLRQVSHRSTADCRRKDKHENNDSIGR